MKKKIDECALCPAYRDKCEIVQKSSDCTWHCLRWAILKRAEKMEATEMKTYPYLANSTLTYGPKWPSYRTVDGNHYRYSTITDTWIFTCGPEI